MFRLTTVAGSVTVAVVCVFVLMTAIGLFAVLVVRRLDACMLVEFRFSGVGLLPDDELVVACNCNCNCCNRLVSLFRLTTVATVCVLSCIVSCTLAVACGNGSRFTLTVHVDACHRLYSCCVGIQACYS